MEVNVSNPADLLAYSSALSRIADWLAEHPGMVDLIGVYADNHVHAMVNPHGDSPAERFAAAARALSKGVPVGTVRKVQDDHNVYVVRDFGGAELHIWTGRDRVCERVVVGTEKVEVADPDAPKIEVEREIVEWKCAPLLADSVAS